MSGENVAFKRLAQSVGGALASSSSSFFDLLFDDDLPVRVSLHPNGRDVVADVWCSDAATLTGTPRRAVAKALLLLNHATLTGRPLRIGMDSRDFILLHGRQPLDGLDSPFFANWLAWLIDQGRHVRALVRTLGLTDGQS